MNKAFAEDEIYGVLNFMSKKNNMIYCILYMGF